MYPQFAVSNEYLSPQHFPPLITHIDSGKIVNSGKKQLTELHQWASNLETFQVSSILSFTECLLYSSWIINTSVTTATSPRNKELYNSINYNMYKPSLSLCLVT